MVDVDKASGDWRRIVPESSRFELVVSGYPNYLDGPVWDARDGSLIFTDAWMNNTPGNIWRWRPSGEVELIVSPCKALGATLDAEGRLVVAGWGGRTIWRREHDGSIVTLASHYGALRINTPNDVVIHSSGAIYWTDPPTAMGGNGRGVDGDDDLQQYLDFSGVLRVWPFGSQVEAVADDFANPNGITFSHDERILYINDTRRRHIRAFDVLPDGSLTNNRIFYAAEADLPGTFDGMKVDVEGNIYCTAPGGIHVINPSGDLIVRILFPGKVGNVAWGGPEWRTLFCTCVDALYRIELNIPGVAVGCQQVER